MPGLCVAMSNVHICLFAALGGKEMDGVNVCVHHLSRELAHQDHYVDVY